MWTAAIDAQTLWAQHVVSSNQASLAVTTLRNVIVAATLLVMGKLCLKKDNAF